MGIHIEHWVNDTDRGNWRNGRKTCPSVSRFSTNPTRTVLGFTSDFRRERPATNRHSHGTALFTEGQYKYTLCIIAQQQTKNNSLVLLERLLKYSTIVTFAWSTKQKSYHLPDHLHHLALTVSPAFTHLHLLSSPRDSPQFALCLKHTRDRLPSWPGFHIRPV